MTRYSLHLPAAVDPTVWGSKLVSNTVGAVAANVYSCTVAIVAAWYAFRHQGSKLISGEPNCSVGLGKT